jgi:hypothetical protein
MPTGLVSRLASSGERLVADDPSLPPPAPLTKAGEVAMQWLRASRVSFSRSARLKCAPLALMQATTGEPSVQQRPRQPAVLCRWSWPARDNRRSSGTISTAAYVDSEAAARRDPSRPASVARHRSERQAASVATIDRDGHRDNGRGSWPRPWSAEGCGGEAIQDELEAERRACGS